MMMYPFFYRPQNLRLEEGWRLFPLEQYFQQIASQVSLEGRDPAGLGGEVTPPTRTGLPPTPHLPQTSQWRLSDVNRDFTTCPTYPPAVIVPAAVGDDALRKAARFRQGGRFPVLSYYHPKNGTVSPSHPTPRPLFPHRQPLGKGSLKPPHPVGFPQCTPLAARRPPPRRRCSAAASR